MREPPFSTAPRSGAPVVTPIQAGLSMSGGAAAAKAGRMGGAGSFFFFFAGWGDAPPNTPANIGTQSKKALLKCLLVACLVFIDISDYLLPDRFRFAS